MTYDTWKTTEPDDEPWAECDCCGKRAPLSPRRLANRLRSAPSHDPSPELIEKVADAIDAARFRSPDYPRERPRPFAEADRSDREYALRLARAALAAIPPTERAES